MQEKLRVAVVVASTREGRVGGGVGRWFVERAGARTGLDLDVVDLADFAIPACYPARPTPAMAGFARRIAAAEAYVVVTPEYNRSFPASLKQAIDCAYDEWRAKPVGFVSYGYRAAGRYAVEQLRGVFTELHTATLRDAVCLDLLEARVADGGFRPDPERYAPAVTTLLDELVWWGLALRDGRRARPYCA
ncbi:MULTISPECIES: NADPH-dependent FMN reductase [unclassified Amycolatopsis]|uniref:NADPH-dependent FMN reductase n=1 Tax=unclassified Amycolatopsis TaxID=2618356 RepID=UPI001C69C821|nr:NAD(P)H-dependent oxidoreductase [Amycolatopsis sp. DSM 110486]QYN17812.1 NAD(P)H-dependent oxidoreductase [Amycolatopsis sp. DSM 110486]